MALAAFATTLRARARPCMDLEIPRVKNRRGCQHSKIDRGHAPRFQANAVPDRDIVRRIYILNFHGLGAPLRPLDPGEERVWVPRRLFAATLDTVRERSDVEITFDDGNDTDLSIALPELQARGLVATFFPVVDRIGRPNFLDWEGLRGLARAGMGIGNHGMRHRPWRGLGDEQLHEELVIAKERLEVNLDASVLSAACPFGAYGRQVLHRARAAGYARFFTSDGGFARESSWLQPRITVTADANVARIVDMLDGRSLKRDAVHRTKRLVKALR
jgi:peptidoglycan/xylan/chitin deacetylase (PgdA/CDA1 family)